MGLQREILYEEIDEGEVVSVDIDNREMNVMKLISEDPVELESIDEVHLVKVDIDKLESIDEVKVVTVEKLSAQVTDQPESDEVDGEKKIFTDKALLCLQSLCLDSPSMCWQMFSTLGYMIGFGILLSLLVLWAYVVFPFQNPEKGFLENWVFNFVAHPVANYLVARACAEWFERQILSDLARRSELQEQRADITSRVKRSVRWAPIVDSLACAIEHAFFSSAKIYPIPFSIALSCVPAAFLSLVVLYFGLPKEVRVLQSTLPFFKFILGTWACFCGLFVIMLAYTALFTSVGMEVQLAMSIYLAAVQWMVCRVVRFLGQRWNVPRHLIREMQTCVKLPVIILKAANLSEAKDFTVVLSMMMPELTQAARTFMLVLLELTSTDTLYEVFSWKSLKARKHLLHSCQKILSDMKLFRQKMKALVKACRATEQEELQNMTWSEEEIHLLNEVSGSLSTVVMLEVCEVMGPAIYMCLLLCLQSNTVLGHNRSYFMGLADAKLKEGLILNGFSLLLEVGILLVTDVCMRALIGLNFVSLIGAVLRCDFSFWLSTLAMAYVAWLTMLIDHTGHDLTFQFKWLN